ncbi:MAG: NADH-quinone oxidoreductase subunit C [Anaerolineae bacterium]|nr:NADH-quinone oxidoreductase subunit C [Anaerolineae bacterium]
MMDYHFALKQVEEILQPFSSEVRRPQEHQIDFVMGAENLNAAVEALFLAQWGYLSAITCLDHPPVKDENGQESEGSLEVIYHFCRNAAVAGLRVSVPYSHPHVPTICNWIPSATLYERELMELFGVVVDDTPSTERLVTSDDWPEGVYPMRKTFSGFSQESR